MAKPRIFVGSATARLSIANALHARLSGPYDVTVWDQGAVRPSEYPLQSLLKRTAETDFAVQIVDADVVQRGADGADVFAPNPNVLVEIGLFMGALGQRRVFLVAPSTFKNIVLPSDLQGLTVVVYEADREDGNWDAAVGPAAHRIRQEIDAQWLGMLAERKSWFRVKIFSDLDDRFKALVSSASEYRTCYVHSRRWRENYGDLLKAQIRSGALTKVHFTLPDIRNPPFVKELAERFDDAPTIPAMILDSFTWLHGLAKEFGPIVSLSMYSRIPSYSYYVFQDVAIIALYNLSFLRKPPPAIEAHKGDDVWNYLLRDLEDFERECYVVSTDEVGSLVEAYANVVPTIRAVALKISRD